MLFLRHAKTPTTGAVLPGRAPGLHLAEEGNSQAKSAAEHIAQAAKRATVYASPLERAQETAAPVAERLGTEIKTEPGLIECDFGSWTGGDLKSLSKTKEWSVVQRWPSGWRFPEGESFAEMQTRMVDTVVELCRRHPGEIVVAVSHADPIKAVLAHAMGTHLDLFQRLIVSPASVSAVLYGTTGPAVLSVNSTGGLPSLKVS